MQLHAHVSNEESVLSRSPPAYRTFWPHIRHEYTDCDISPPTMLPLAMSFVMSLTMLPDETSKSLTRPSTDPHASFDDDASKQGWMLSTFTDVPFILLGLCGVCL
jgi:hypothetical protein